MPVDQARIINQLKNPCTITQTHEGPKFLHHSLTRSKDAAALELKRSYIFRMHNYLSKAVNVCADRLTFYIFQNMNEYISC